MDGHEADAVNLVTLYCLEVDSLFPFLQEIFYIGRAVL